MTKFEQDGSLVILDSVRGYFGSEFDTLSTIKILSKCAENQGKEGCCVIADMGVFYEELTQMQPSPKWKYAAISVLFNVSKRNC